MWETTVRMALVPAAARETIGGPPGPVSQRLPLTLCHFQHFDLLLGGGAHFLNRGQDGRESLHQNFFEFLLDRAGGRAWPSVSRRAHAVPVLAARYPDSPTSTAARGAGTRPEPRRGERANAWKRGGGAWGQEVLSVIRFGPRVFVFLNL